MKIIKYIVSAAAALAVTASAGYAADPAQGLALSQRWCAACHVVSADQKEASTDAPPFSTVARSPHFSVRGLAYFLLDPHPKMPDLPLSRQAADDIAAYIATLRN